MIEEMCIVERAEGRHIWVKPLSAAGGCGGCKSAGSCSTSFLATFFQKNNGIQVENTVDALVGDTVVLAAHPQGLLLGAVFTYLLPLVTLFIGAIIGSFIVNEVGSISFGLLGLGAGILMSKRISSSSNFSTKFQLAISKQAEKNLL